MIRTFCKLVLGLTLTGCTVNNIHNDNYSVAYKISHHEVTIMGKEKPTQEALPPAVVSPVVTGNIHIRSECGPYVPLPVPEPVKIDMTKLQQAESSQVINKIILDNVKDLRNQMISFSLRQQRHYADYVRRCVVR
jgi:hypothetical protein